MSDQIREVSGNCSRCKAGYSGRVTDKALESWGWRKINGQWVCYLCTGAGPIKRVDPEEEP